MISVYLPSDSLLQHLPSYLDEWFSGRYSNTQSLSSLSIQCNFNNNILIASLVAQTVKCLSTMQETWVRALGWGDPLEKEMTIHSRTIAWKIPWTEEPGRLQSMGSQRVGHDWAISLSLSHFHVCYTYNTRRISRRIRYLEHISLQFRKKQNR